MTERRSDRGERRVYIAHRSCLTPSQHVHRCLRHDECARCLVYDYDTDGPGAVRNIKTRAAWREAIGRQGVEPTDVWEVRE